MPTDTPAAERERLRRFAFLVLAPGLGRRRRAGLAYGAVDAALAKARGPEDVRVALVGEVLRVGNSRTGLPTLIRVPRPSRQVGHPVGETEHHLGALIPAARAAYLLTHLDGLGPAQTRAVLRAAGVADPDTALSLALKSPLEPGLVAAVHPPAPHRVAPRLVAAGVGVVVLGVAAPVIAVTTGGNDSPAEPASVTRPVGPTKEEAAAAEATAQKLARLLGRLEERLADHKGTAADKKKLRALRDAMAAQLKQLNATAKAQGSGTGAPGK